LSTATQYLEETQRCVASKSVYSDMNIAKTSTPKCYRQL